MVIKPLEQLFVVARLLWSTGVRMGPGRERDAPGNHLGASHGLTATGLGRDVAVGPVRDVGWIRHLAERLDRDP